ncbi:MAG: hypothetical protein AAFY76_22275, partial [Cyanobacteria bacterium J06649_11]
FKKGLLLVPCQDFRTFFVNNLFFRLYFLEKCFSISTVQENPGKTVVKEHNNIRHYIFYSVKR